MSKLIVSSAQYLFLLLGLLTVIACTPSYGGKKHQFIDPHDHSQMHKAGQKTENSISVESIGNNQFRVVGSVTAREDFFDGVLLWTIPKTTSLVSSSLSESFNLAAGDTQDFEIIISGLKDGDKIVMLPHKIVKKEKHGIATLYTHGQKFEADEPSKFQKTTNGKKIKIFQ